jgi:ComF family protein
VVNSLLEGLFPSYCELCGLRSRRALPLCRPCERELQANARCCERCAIPLPEPPAAIAAGEAPSAVCGRCLQCPPPFERALAPWLYCERLARLIHRWKFQGEDRLTGLLAHLWLSRAGAPAAVDLMVPVPLHWRRLWQRGFNQSELLCRALRAASPQLAEAGLDPRRVRRNRATAAQSGIPASGRRANLRGAFTACGACDNLRVAIVDDVLTTGETACELARELRRAGADRVEVWCLARTPAPAG